MDPYTHDKTEFVIWLNQQIPDLPSLARQRLLDFGALVEASAERLGLVGRGDRSHIYVRHFQESLAAPLRDSLPRGAKVLDVGSGGGFPALPLAIVRDDLSISLSEPRRKKTAFLERAVLQLGLANVSVHPLSLEEMGRAFPEERWDVALSRGVRWTPRMVEAVRIMLSMSGTVVRFGPSTSPDPQVEVRLLPAGSARGIQVWPRPAWSRLPHAE
jgi:16S rRNA (guanine527-N7)-methyltransferase